jgi:hypothetical protein
VDRVETIQHIQALIEIMIELEDLDTMGNGITIKIKILNKIEDLIDSL